jgi:hypothetical protein
MDSGGPAFFHLGGKDYLVAIANFVTHLDCRGAFGEQRLDTADTLGFVQAMIAPRTIGLRKAAGALQAQWSMPAFRGRSTDKLASAETL